MSQQKDSNSTAQPMAPPGGYPYYPTGYDVEDEISLVDLWRVLMARKWMIFWVTILFTLGAVGYALVAPEVYKAEAVLAPVKQESGGQMAALASQFGGLASLAGVNLGGGGGSTDEAIAILQS
ncbi:MAG: LPS O-antigen length regulator, partial [Gammaproteobacteria bacterium]|nr:LPS O-antigen length regulator [Gammaproteobacteria bacterium]